jgi:hypothetical protein
MARPLLTAALLAVVAAPLGGCFHDATEVVVVTDTDLTPTEFGSMAFNIADANGNGFMAGASFSSTQGLPATLGVEPAPGISEFTVTVLVWPPGVQGGGPFGRPAPGNGEGTAAPLASRKASHVRFVDEQQLVLFIPISRTCVCDATNCPHALDPECREIIAPKLPGFDPDHLPRLSP